MRCGSRRFLQAARHTISCMVGRSLGALIPGLAGALKGRLTSAPHPPPPGRSFLAPRAPRPAPRAPGAPAPLPTLADPSPRQRCRRLLGGPLAGGSCSPTPHCSVHRLASLAACEHHARNQREQQHVNGTRPLPPLSPAQENSVRFKFVRKIENITLGPMWKRRRGGPLGLGRATPATRPLSRNRCSAAECVPTGGLSESPFRISKGSHLLESRALDALAAGKLRSVAA